VRTGRPRRLDDAFRRHLRELHRCGMSDKAIAASLNRSGIDTPHVVHGA
jgi:IS30 family transposase